MGSQIFVTNMNGVDAKGNIDPKTAFDHVDRYDGEEYVFPTAERVLIPEEAAVHFFGRGLADQSETLVRLGWAMKYDPLKKQFVEDPDGVRKLARFVFEEAIMVSKSSLERKLAEKASAPAA